ncbi:hypothetical protein BGZ70_002724 [Mortierella alpina]|uniref:SCD domain-containing protein n=1 Tax=Mortierella alpina TaxID=64518 RepID=A0A9P6ITZ5_MORAP|nr:hypothetical protein BGZ70_002724 [Mortierella alpina]
MSNNTSSGASTRRSTRTKSQAADSNAVTKGKPAARSRRAPKSNEDAIDSGEDVEDVGEGEGSGEDEDEQLNKDIMARTSRKKAVNISSTGTKNAAPQKSTTKQSAKAAVDTSSEEEESASSSEEDVDSGSDFEEARPKLRSKTNPAESAVIKARKPKASKASKAVRGAKARGASAARRKSTTAAVEDGEGDDSALYDAVLDSQAALDVVAADWIDLYKSSRTDALRKLTNFLIRSCGCKQSVSAEDFANVDDMVETLKSILLRYKESTVNFDYPIVSKAKEFKKFRRNFLELYTRLIQKAQADILFDGEFMDSLLAWTISLSSSTFRPVRHTATTAALHIVTSLADIAAEVQEELNVTSRQLATSQKQKATQTKLKQLEKKVTEGQRRKEELGKWIDDIFDSVYVLRCRDVDPVVRADCVRELGQWMIVNPDHFLESNYIRYIVWVLSDKAAVVRLESLKVLAKLYENGNQASALRHFTDRLTERVVEMALGETDTFARLGAIRVATLIHKHGQLEEEDQVKLSTLIFGANAKVRKALAKFVKARVWEDEIESRMAACDVLTSSSQVDANDVKKDRIELKSLVCFLIKVGKSDSQQSESEEHSDKQSAKEGTRLFDETKVGRIALAVEALWSEIDALKNWKSIAEYLMEDHSTAPTVSSQRGSAKPATLEEIYHLNEDEENILLETFIASLQLTLNPPAVPGFQKDKAKQKAHLDDVKNEVARYCVDVLPQLFLKYGVDADRIRCVLIIPQLISLNVYLDMRMLTAYEDLVEEVVKVFKRHTDPSVLHTAATTIRTMQGYEILRPSHEAKIEALGKSLLDTFLGLTANASDDNVAESTATEELTLCLRRLEHLIKFTDVTNNMTRSTEQAPFDSLVRVTGRYKGVQGQRAELPISALSVAFLWISWICRAHASKYGQDTDWSEQDVRDVRHMQEALLGMVTDLAITETQGIDSRVRRKAFQVLGDMYWLFGGDMFHSSRGANRHLLYKPCPETIQAECESFVRTEIELWGEKVQEKMEALRLARTPKAARGHEAEDRDSDDEENRNDETGADPSELLEDEKLAAAQVEQEDKNEMFVPVFSFMRQIILKDFSMPHAVAVIANYGRFGHEFDEGVKRVVASIKAQTTEGPSKQVRDHKAEKFMDVCMESLKESFEIFMDGHVQSSNQALQLAKVLMGLIRPAGFLQSTRVGIDLRLVWRMQKQGIVYAMEKIAGYATIEDEVKKSKMIKFFDLLSQMLFGVPPSSAEIASIQSMIQSECENRNLEVTDDSAWDPLRTYQAKLEKLTQKAAAERVALEAAQVREKAQEAQEQRDAIMTAVQEAPEAPEEAEASGSAPQSHAIVAQGNGSGKKRLATPEDDHALETEGAEEAIQQQLSRASSVGRSGSDAEPEAGPSSRAVKETKRLRVQ